MKRPSIQFYPADWRSNSNLKRCSLAARGTWLEIMCVLHDSDEYGVCRWPLDELLRVAGVPMKLAKELLDRNVMKGSSNNFAGYSHTTTHAGMTGETFILVPPCDTPVWFSSRMVVDEFIRTRRGASTRFDSENQPPSRSPTGRVGESPTRRQGNGPSSSSSSTSSSTIQNSALCEVPNWKEIKEYAAGHGVTEKSARGFFDHHQGNNLWVNGYGRLIDWRHKMITWQVKDREKASMSEHSTIIPSKQQFSNRGGPL